MSKLTKFLRAFLPVKFMDDAAKVAPAVQSEIDRVLHNASAQVARLRAEHSVATANLRLEAELQRADFVAADYRELLKERADRIAQNASLVLPPLVLPDTGPAVTDPK